MKYLKFLPMGLFSLFFVKCLVFTPSYQEMGILAVLAALTGLFEAKNHDQKLKALEDKMNVAVKSFEEKEIDIKRLQESLNSLKLGALVRPMNVQQNK